MGKISKTNQKYHWNNTRLFDSFLNVTADWSVQNYRIKSSVGCWERFCLLLEPSASLFSPHICQFRHVAALISVGKSFSILFICGDRVDPLPYLAPVESRSSPFAKRTYFIVQGLGMNFYLIVRHLQRRSTAHSRLSLVGRVRKCRTAWFCFALKVCLTCWDVLQI